MKPDRSNYEIWIIDWLDGNLTAEGENLLMEFLENNPDIREEADSLMSSKLSSGINSPRSFKGLKKSPSELDASQVGYLSAAYLEKDLSPEQEEDLMQSLKSNSESRLIFDSIQRTKLRAPFVAFPEKGRLKKITLSGTIVRIAVAGLSAAAIIMFFLFNRQVVPGAVNYVPKELAASSEVIIYKNPPIIVKEKIVPVVKPEKIAVPVAVNFPDSNTVVYRVQGPEVVTPSMFSGIDRPAISNSLVPVIFQMLPGNSGYDDDRSALSKFLAHAFRSKILKEKKEGDEPIQTYEFAQAGIEGLNKLLGWQMALEKTNDSTGNLKSLYFSSRMLKFNAPVRKTSEPE
jgi:hypothetical protein